MCRAGIVRIEWECGRGLDRNYEHSSDSSHRARVKKFTLHIFAAHFRTSSEFYVILLFCLLLLLLCPYLISSCFSGEDMHTNRLVSGVALQRDEPLADCLSKLFS